jgi:Tfp pilus assembly protein PilN
MTRFNYLHDAPPETLERLRPSRVPEQLRTPLAALLTTCIVVCIWWGIEQLALGQARSELGREQLRVDASRTELKELRLHKEQATKLLALDTRLRGIRVSGARTAAALADIANHLPSRTWLTSVSRVDDTLEIDGRAVGFDALSSTLTDLSAGSGAASPRLTRAASDERDRSVIAFTLRATPQ